MKQEVPLIQLLQERGLVAQVTDSAALSDILSKQSITLYCGFDPTADSLHLGHLIPLLMLRRFQAEGHRPIALVGGATGMIGDPSFKAAERKLNTPEITANWVQKIRTQVEPFLSFEGDNAAIVVNNYDWFGGMNTLDFLRDVGKHFSVNAMISKESVKQRIDRSDFGISFTEFAYSLLQSYDFAQLSMRYNCSLQIGGSDQWGNITAGIDLIRRLAQQTVYGLTLPLVTKSDGTKFGKTESGAVWLDAKRTSPYKFYQFWLNVTDDDVYRFMKLFTFMPLEEIQSIEITDKSSDAAPQAQRLLADHVTALVHGKEAVEAARRISRSLFAEDQDALTQNDFEQLALDGLSSSRILSEQSGLIDALVSSGLAASKSQARGFVDNGAIAVNGKKITSLDYRLSETDRCYGHYTLLRRGKKNHALLIWE